MPPPTSSGLLCAPGFDASIRQALVDMVLEPHDGERVAAFDFDETCIFGDISESMLALLDVDASEDLVTPYREAVRRDPRDAYTDLVSTLIAGRTEEEVRALTLRTLDWAQSNGAIVLREAMRELVWAMHRHHWQVWIVTASPESVVQPIAERFGIHPHRVLGMRCRKDAAGRYVRGVMEPVTYRQGKLDALRMAASADPWFAAGDSRTDEALLRSARHALLFDRDDPELLREAHAAGWWVQKTESMQ